MMLDCSIDVYAADTSRGWRVVRQVTPIQAYNKVTRGKWHELFDELGNFFGVQVTAAVKTDQDLQSGATAATITYKENVLYSCGGPSHTIGMSEDARITRYSNRLCRALPPEDRMERVIAKVQQWPFPASRIDNGRGPVPNEIYSRVGEYGDRALRVYPPRLP
jgi:hypothetical protein